MVARWLTPTENLHFQAVWALVFTFASVLGARGAGGDPPLDRGHARRTAYAARRRAGGGDGRGREPRRARRRPRLAAGARRRRGVAARPADGRGVGGELRAADPGPRRAARRPPAARVLRGAGGGGARPDRPRRRAGAARRGRRGGVGGPGDRGRLPRLGGRPAPARELDRLARRPRPVAGGGRHRRGARHRQRLVRPRADRIPGRGRRDPRQVARPRRADRGDHAGPGSARAARPGAGPDGPHGGAVEPRRRHAPADPRPRVHRRRQRRHRSRWRRGRLPHRSVGRGARPRLRLPALLGAGGARRRGHLRDGRRPAPGRGARGAAALLAASRSAGPPRSRPRPS